MPSLQDDYELMSVEHEQVCESGRYMDSGWLETMQLKVDLIIRAIQENWGEVFIHSDVDIQFFGPTQKMIMKLIRGKDLVIQRNGPRGGLCAGFFAARGNAKNLRLWQNIKAQLSASRMKNDQDILNDCLISTFEKWGRGFTFYISDKYSFR